MKSEVVVELQSWNRGPGKPEAGVGARVLESPAHRPREKSVWSRAVMARAVAWALLASQSRQPWAPSQPLLVPGNVQRELRELWICGICT